MNTAEVLAKTVGLLHAGDLEGFLGMLDDNCVIMKDEGEVIARGMDQLKVFYAQIFAEQSDMEVDIPAQFEAGNVAAVYEINKNMNVNGVHKDVDSVWIYKVMNNKITYMHVFSPDEAASEDIASFA